MFLFLFESTILKKGPGICKEIQLYSVQVMYSLEIQ